MRSDVLGESVHHGMTNGSYEAVEEVVTVLDGVGDKRKLIWTDI